MFHPGERSSIQALKLGWKCPSRLGTYIAEGVPPTIEACSSLLSDVKKRFLPSSNHLLLLERTIYHDF